MTTRTATRTAVTTATERIHLQWQWPCRCKRRGADRPVWMMAVGHDPSSQRRPSCIRSGAYLLQPDYARVVYSRIEKGYFQPIKSCIVSDWALLSTNDARAFWILPN